VKIDHEGRIWSACDRCAEQYPLEEISSSGLCPSCQGELEPEPDPLTSGSRWSTAMPETEKKPLILAIFHQAYPDELEALHESIRLVENEADVWSRLITNPMNHLAAVLVFYRGDRRATFADITEATLKKMQQELNES
jgi:hypothetical protein